MLTIEANLSKLPGPDGESEQNVENRATIRPYGFVMVLCLWKIFPVQTRSPNEN